MTLTALKILLCVVRDRPCLGFFPNAALDLQCQKTVAGEITARNCLGKKDEDLFHLDWVKGTLALVMDG